MPRRAHPPIDAASRSCQVRAPGGGRSPPDARIHTGEDAGGPIGEGDGIGGAFFRARDPLALAHWYQEHLGIDSGLDGDVLWTQNAGPTVWAPFPADTKKFGPRQGVMFNFRVRDLSAMVQQLHAAGVPLEGEVTTEAGAGKFAWIRDPEGNAVELWEPEARP